MIKNVLLFLGFTAIVNAQNYQISYPKDYREWTHVKSMVINDSHSLADSFEGIHHIYANSDALSGLKTNVYKNGSTFVFDLLDAKRSKEAIIEGDRKFIGVMQYDTTKYQKTGNWGFEVFAKDSKTKRVVSDGGISCFSCHKAVKEKSYIFSNYRK